MGKALAIIGLIMLLLVGSCVGCAWWGMKQLNAIQGDFYAVVASGDASKVKAQFASGVAVDDAQLAAWVKAMNEQLGAYTGMALEDGFKFDTQTQGDGEAWRVAGKAEFEKGTARSILRTLNGKVLGLKVESDLPGVAIEIGDVGKPSSDEAGSAGGGDAGGGDAGNAGGGNAGDGNAGGADDAGGSDEKK